jgi:LysR family carnitine catabolism transcriptional activator
MNIPFRKLQTLACLAETGSFSGAARILNLSQPAVSAHIRELEDDLGVALVSRTTRRVALTREGEALAARATRAISELALAAQDVRETSTAHRGRVVVSCIPPLMATVIPEVVRRLDEAYPEVELRLIDGRSGQVEPMILRGETDFGLGPRPASAEARFEHLYRDPFVAAVAADHPLAGRETVTLAELLRHPFIANSRDTNARQIVDRAMLRLRRPATPRFELVRYYSVGQFVEAGLGVTILPRMAFRSLASDRVVAVPISTPRIHRDIGVISRPEYRPSPAAEAFMLVLRAVMRERLPDD